MGRGYYWTLVQYAAVSTGLPWRATMGKDRSRIESPGINKSQPTPQGISSLLDQSPTCASPGILFYCLIARHTDGAKGQESIRRVWLQYDLQGGPNAPRMDVTDTIEAAPPGSVHGCRIRRPCSSCVIPASSLNVACVDMLWRGYRQPRAFWTPARDMRE